MLILINICIHKTNMYISLNVHDLTVSYQILKKIYKKLIKIVFLGDGAIDIGSFNQMFKANMH